MVYAICAAAGLGGAALGFFLIALINARRRKKARKGAQGKRKIETTKLVIFFVLGTYFIGVFIGMKVVLIDFSQLGVWLAFIGTPTVAAIGFYVWKAKAENIIKYKKDNPTETDGIPVDLNNINT
jgi:hypothetical protein